jgi:uncharacterized protein YbaP (TraB family)
MKYFLAVLAFINMSLMAQNNKSLLWEISGNGLKSPSYLYGTIHSSQEKFFDLPDSVFNAIENTESFAGELNMDSLQFFGAKFISGFKSYTSAELLLDEKDFNRLKEIIKKRLGTAYETLPVKDPAFIATLLEQDNFKGSMPFTLDEYLYQLAKTKDKTILGIETFDEQLNLLNGLSDKDKKDILLDILNDDSVTVKKIYAELADAYYYNDLDKVEKLVSSEISKSADIESRFLIKRNYKMADAISRFAKTKSLFAAVGAAHLPGKEGVIALLKKNGYSLRPVKVIRTGIAKKYLGDISDKPWFVFSPGDKGFSIEMPGEPSKLPVPANIPNTKADAVFYNETGTQSVYIVVRYINPEPFTEENADSMFTKLSGSMAASGMKIIGNVASSKKDGILLKEFNAGMMGYVNTTKVYFKNNSMYWLQSMVPEKQIDDSRIRKFFNSFRINK